MTTPLQESPAAIAATLLPLSPDYAPTPLLDLPRLAARLGVAQVLAKDEGRRMGRSFKSLGGTYAGLRALSRWAGMEIPALIAERPAGLPPLICASDGNHGLAVAAAARFAGGPARVYLHHRVPESRAQRIAALGAEIVWITGTYDDTVDAAAMAARRGEGLLIADTALEPEDPVVNDVMAGYGVIAHEARAQAEAAGHPAPTHLVIHSGVGGLAAAMAAGVADWLAAPAAIIVADPAEAPSVDAALKEGRPVRVQGALETAAEMLACGEASGPALAVLMAHGAKAVLVPEAAFEAAPQALLDAGGPASTPSGTAGLAGALHLAAQGALPPEARLLLVISEAALPTLSPNK
ncbi:pyridoxal-phosphate dependent enzyme [Acetobacteraceae bacterium H6797]|nr:pyridoxal-phosphate dependent enzyme [Acetobacteraceae bacterium H6797]